MWIYLILLILHGSSCQDFGKLNWTLRDHISSEILDFARFDLATRTNCRGTKQEVSVLEQIDSDLGREELKAGYEHARKLVDSALPGNLKPGSCQHYRGEYGSQCLGDVGKRYVFDQGQLHIKRFSRVLSSGHLLTWPMYCYDRDLLKPQIEVFSEDLAFDQQGSVPRIDWGPPTPHFEKLQELQKKIDLYNRTGHFPWVSSSPKWLPGTPLKDQHSDLFKLYHIVPLPVLASFYEVFSAVWHEMDAGRRQMASAPLRILNRTAEAAKRILAGRLLNSTNYNNDYQALKEEVSRRFNFDYDPIKIFFWAPGNLYWGYDDLKKGTNDEKFNADVEVIIGNKRFKKAEMIYNHILDFMDRAGCPVGSNQIVNDEKVVKTIMSDQALFTELKELFHKMVYFGLERNEPYPVDETLWEPLHSTGVWAWKIISLNETDVSLDLEDDFVDNRIAMEWTIHDACHSIAQTSFRKRRSILTNSNEYLAFADSEARSLLTNETDIGLILRDFAARHEGSYSTSLSSLSEFVRNESINYYTDQHCSEGSYLCSRVESACGIEDIDDATIRCDERDEPNDRTCPGVEISRRGYATSASFPEWCDGKRFDNKNQVTTDSVVIRVLTHNQTKPNRFNKRILVDLYGEYSKSGKNNFVDYLEDQIQKYNTTASRILNQACRVYKEAPQQKPKMEEAVKVMTKRLCYLPQNRMVAFYCIANYVSGGFLRYYLSSKVNIFNFGKPYELPDTIGDQ